MWVVIGIVVGAWIGLESGSSVVVWAVLGGIAGFLVQRRAGPAAPEVEARLGRLEAELLALRRELQLLRGGEPGEASAADAGAPAGLPEAVPVVAAERAEMPRPAPRPVPAPMPMPEPAPARGPGTLDLAWLRVREWLVGGNTLMRVGLLVLFFGFAFLARYAVEHSLLPVELRLAGIAGGGIALLAVGWRLRGRRRGYALSMQGGGVAVLYLTVFAAMRLYALLPAGPAFMLLLAMVALAALLAVLQDAPALAVIGTAGGFLAPILASTGQGSHVSLFTYYTLLDLGVLAIAWKKAWRALNLTGFLFTFTIALAWGARDYRPELFASTEPFLIGFFLIFVAAAVLYAWRQAPRLGHYVDGGIVFGTPVVGFGLQAALAQHIEYALAWSALAVGGFYVLLARALLGRRRDSLRLLVESFLALGVAFLTLAIPLALDGRWTAAAWAMEGAALLWVGVRQQRRLAIAAGLLLQLGAGAFFAGDGGLASHGRALPLANAQLVGALLLALSGFFAGREAHRHVEVWPRLLRPAGAVLAAWATLWWLAGGIGELDAWLGGRDMPAAMLLLFAASAALAGAIAPRAGWNALFGPALLPAPGMLLALLASLATGHSPGYGWGLPAWLVMALVHARVLGQAERVEWLRRALPAFHVAGLWLLVSAFAVMLADAADARFSADSWPLAALAVPPVAALTALLWAHRRQRWPVAAWPAAYLSVAGGGMVTLLLLWLLVLTLGADGEAAPLPYLPLANPLELMFALTLLACARWWQVLRGDPALGGHPAVKLMPAVLAGLAFVVANGVLLRALHHYGGIRWEARAMFDSAGVQMALSLFWATLGLILTYLASRAARRLPWMLGAALLGVVVAKLFLVDMASTGTVARIVSFLGAGALLLVVGYFSPLPPARESKP